MSQPLTLTWQQLNQLLGKTSAGPDGLTIKAVTEDSRRVTPGALFVAVSGETEDGHDHGVSAVNLGAVAILGDRRNLELFAGVPYIYHAKPREATGLVAHTLAGNPSKDLIVIGVTGTNGKSSTCALIESILNAAGHTVANFGTLGYTIAGKHYEASHTTPFGETLAAMFAEARDAGVSHVVMECSSHALDQGQVAGIHFDAALFTNLTQDHLDYHATMAAYVKAKSLLFKRLDAKDGVAVVNAEDDHSVFMAKAAPCAVLQFGKKGDVKSKHRSFKFDGTRCDLHTPWGKSPLHLKLLGKHNLANALAAAAITGGLGIKLTHIVMGLEALTAVPGRFEAIYAGQHFYVIVDYAHTDDGLKNVLQAARKFCNGKIITVFGCGGDRDKGKRPKMGKVAATLSDYCIITSDNPRTEDPHRILLDVEMGVQRTEMRKDDDYQVIESREEAIRAAIQRATPGDLVMIAGKGHEDYQIFGTEKIHFDDREIARAILEEK